MAAKIESMNDDALKYWKTYAQTNNLVDVLDVRDLLATLRSEFVMSTENARDSGQSFTNTSNIQQHSQQLSSRVAGIIHFNS